MVSAFSSTAVVKVKVKADLALLEVKTGKGLGSSLGHEGMAAQNSFTSWMSLAVQTAQLFGSVGITATWELQRPPL